MRIVFKILGVCSNAVRGLLRAVILFGVPLKCSASVSHKADSGCFRRII